MTQWTPSLRLLPPPPKKHAFKDMEQHYIDKRAKAQLMQDLERHLKQQVYSLNDFILLGLDSNHGNVFCDKDVF